MSGAIRVRNEVRDLRAPGEAERIKFDRHKHPGIIKRAARAGLQDGQIAALLGITVGQWKNWLATKSEVRQALEERRESLTEIAAALLDSAVGVIGEDGARKGVNVKAAEVYLRHFAGNLLAEPETPEEDDTKALAIMAKALLKKVSDRKQAPTPVIDVTDTEEDLF